MQLTGRVVQMDSLTPAQRSERMARIRSKNTQPEVRVRRLVHRLGYRFRLHRNGMPGRPDLVFPARRKVIFVHGCFWHAHEGCNVANLPKSNTEFWREKFARNRERDATNRSALVNDGWDVMILWECEISKPDIVMAALTSFLGPGGHSKRRRVHNETSIYGGQGVTP
jgi:DNA mismatch endonuclease, patch repair protein